MWPEPAKDRDLENQTGKLGVAVYTSNLSTQKPQPGYKFKPRQAYSEGKQQEKGQAGV